MQKLSLSVRQALNYRSQRWRRRQVVFWGLTYLCFVLTALGDKGHGFIHFVRLSNPFLSALPLITWTWQNQRRPIVSSLEDRAQWQYGTSFEALAEQEKNEILSHYRVGNYRLIETEDERMKQEKLQAHEKAYRIMRTVFIIFLMLYLAGYYWLPNRPDVRINPRGLLDAPVWIVALVTFALALPSAVWLWMEPDAPGESSVVAMREKQA